MNYDKELIKAKFEEIKGDALKNLKKDGYIPSFALTPRELKIIEEGHKLGYNLHVVFNDKKMRVPITKMRF